MQPRVDPRVKIFDDHPGLLSSIGEVLFPDIMSRTYSKSNLSYVKSLLGILVRLYITIVNPAVRERCLTAITKILYFSTPDMLTESMKVSR